jgi:polysaccharide export outer membrane protein
MKSCPFYPVRSNEHLPARTAVTRIGRRIRTLLMAVVWSSFAVTGAAGQPSDLIHRGDVIDVDVIGSVEWDWRGTLTPEGFLDGLDQIPKQIYALCRTREEVAAEITTEYSRILRDPRVTVSILDTSNRAVAVMNGAIRTPHRFRIQREVSLQELIVLAGGITDSASGEIRIQRPQGSSCSDAAGKTAEGPNVRVVKISDLIKGVAAANPAILSGDIITVLEAFPIYVIGGVQRPGSINSREKITLSRAVAIAGGLTGSAREDSVTIHRRNATPLKADLELIEDEKQPDPELLPFDIVEVEERGRAPRRLPPDVDSIGRRFPNGSAQTPLKIVD